MLRNITILLVALMLTACEMIPQQRVNQAKLMPRDIAIKTIDMYTPMGFSSNPTLPYENSLSPMCKDRTPKPVRFEDMSLLSDEKKVTVFVKHEKNFWCGNGLKGTFKIPNKESKDDFVDALIFLGAKPALVKQ